MSDSNAKNLAKLLNTDTTVNVSDIADGSVTSAKIGDGEVSDAKIASGVTASKLTGALPAIDGSSLTGVDPADGSITTAKLDDGAVTAAKIGSLPAGSVLQVVQSTFGSTTAISSLTYVSTGHTLSITPSSASSKILISYYFLIGQTRDPASTQDNVKYFSIFRNGTDISPHTDNFIAHQNHASGNISFNEQTQVATMCFLDSPATTSAITYDNRAKADNLAVTIQYNRRGLSGGNLVGSAIAIAMEIAG